MTLQEFSALKVGDKIENAMSQSSGEVTEVTKHGVRVAWGLNKTFTPLYTMQGTQWFHWSKVDA